MRYDGIRLSKRHRIWFYSIFAALFFSGTLWWVFHNWLQAKGEFGTTPHPAETWFLKIHGAAAMATLVILGTLIPTHMKRAWRAHRNRGNGLMIIGLTGLLIATGYGLYYLGGDSIRAAVSWLHTYVGLALPFLLVFHILAGRKTRKHK